ncbi:ribose-phosphate pyrophosphokinase [Candidatus Carsonella ruddii CS isolate Thao2000]|uniref:ribose-phosphate diphosphokinase n=1 Tax=Candidatus Carsonella ruddii CS isolate Thao2000 TaxID=1202537 RepID=J7H089_CARRU|nr:ribose-phosphate diphosphokinase [Candidatus Carsonella ruddii]AFP83710.1 ribose-phosphate pyrophosphokinase [Candidatus Carsonella ruddii CS isolate Thao2000]
MKIIKPNIIFGSSNLFFFNSLLNIFNIKKNFLKIEKFKDGEFKIKLLKNFSEKTVFILQSLCNPIHENIIELLLIIDALKRNFVKNIYLVIPYFCYSRQDKLFLNNTSISIKAIVNIIDICKIKKIITIDSHSKNFECLFVSPIKILKSTSLIVNDIIKNNILAEIIISPDIGGIERAKNLANYLNLELVIIDKRRPIINNIKIYCIIGNVLNKHCLIIDDIIDTSNSLIELVNFLFFHKIKKVKAYITHPVFSNNSYLKIYNSKIDELIIMDTIILKKKISKIRIITTKYIFIEEIKKTILNYAL